jgi:hypothetical protein
MAATSRKAALLQSCELCATMRPDVGLGVLFQLREPQVAENRDLDVAAVAEARVAALALLESRKPGATVCPSEVARTLAGGSEPGTASDNWRSAMPTVHASVDELLAEGHISLSWKGKALPERAGPYRINRGNPDQSP